MTNAHIEELESALEHMTLRQMTKILKKEVSAQARIVILAEIVKLAQENIKANIELL